MPHAKGYGRAEVFLAIQEAGLLQLHVCSQKTGCSSGHDCAHLHLGLGRSCQRSKDSQLMTIAVSAWSP